MRPTEQKLKDIAFVKTNNQRGGGVNKFVRKGLEKFSSSKRPIAGVEVLVCSREQCWYVYDYLTCPGRRPLSNKERIK